MTYLTPSLAIGVDAPSNDLRFAHVTWDKVGKVVRSLWGSSEVPDERRIVDVLLATLERLDVQTPTELRELLLGRPVPVVATPDVEPEASPLPQARPASDTYSEALRLAELTAQDGEQRAVDYLATDPEDLEELRLEVCEVLSASPEGSPLRRVMPWRWRWKSTGRPMTSAGAETGYELRISRNKKPVY